MKKVLKFDGNEARKPKDWAQDISNKLFYEILVFDR